MTDFYLRAVRSLHRDAYAGTPDAGRSCGAGCGAWPCATLRVLDLAPSAQAAPVCTCVSGNPMDYDGPQQDCPKHGDPQVLGYCPLDQHEQWRAECERLSNEVEELRATVTQLRAELGKEKWARGERPEANVRLRAELAEERRQHSNTIDAVAALRAAVLREAADEAEAENASCPAVILCQPCATRALVARRLRRLADETKETRR
ncbi:hypothetical protein [Streptomyces sp. NPDC088923]|uniref:hypothetical protein n=1 Tax=Streptomyces sp. NPDC088923 TaxID=3365913 RepID=UPI0038237CDD